MGFILPWCHHCCLSHMLAHFTRPDYFDGATVSSLM